MDAVNGNVVVPIQTVMLNVVEVTDMVKFFLVIW